MAGVSARKSMNFMIQGPRSMPRSQVHLIHENDEMGAQLSFYCKIVFYVHRMVKMDIFNHFIEIMQHIEHNFVCDYLIIITLCIYLLDFI